MISSLKDQKDQIEMKPVKGHYGAEVLRKSKNAIQHRGARLKRQAINH
jgi:hypothetical protein